MPKVKVRIFGKVKVNQDGTRSGKLAGVFVSEIYSVSETGEFLVYDPDKERWLWVNPFDVMKITIGDKTKFVSTVKPVEAW